jgi:hypothetical protein
LDPILLLSQILLSGTTVFFIAENIYLRNSSYYSRYTKTIEVNSKVTERYIYKNLKLRKNFSTYKMEIPKIFYTGHLSYWEKERNKKALNFINNSMPS